MDDSSNESGLEEITDDEVLRLAWEHHALDLHTGIPARVDSFDAGSSSKPPTVKVTLMLNRMVPDGNGDYVSEKLPQLADVLVQYPRTKKFFCVFPLEAGDEGLVLFAEANIAAWRATGNQTDPGDVARHTLDGAVFLPGVCSDKNGLQSTLGSNMLIGRDGTDGAQIEFTDTETHLGKGADDKVLTAKDAQALHDAIKNAAVVANDGGAAFKANLLTALLAAGWTPLAGVLQLGCNTIKGKR